MAMACNPRLLIADEPTTALDVTIQAQVLEVMARLSREFGTAVIIITHNLGVVARYADRVNVMYAGKIIETSTAEKVYGDPRHPYTQVLLAAIPSPNPRHRGQRKIQTLDTDEGARTLGELGIGTNYKVPEFTGDILMDEKIGGTVHLAVGASYPETGGTNDSAVHWDMVCDLRRGGRITVDGETLMTDGRFVA